MTPGYMTSNAKELGNMLNNLVDKKFPSSFHRVDM